jgi:hypothetical protein
MVYARLAALAAVAVLAASCSSMGGTNSSARPFDEASAFSEDILLTVENNDLRDATVHVVWGGMKSRAGSVTAKTTQTFRLRWRSEEVQLEADFLGGGGFRSERVPVYPGDHLNFVIMSGG